MFHYQPGTVLDVAHQQQQKQHHMQQEKHQNHPEDEEMMYIFIHLKREATDQPWGITFSRLDGKFIVGNVNQGLSHPRIDWYHPVSVQDSRFELNRIFLPPMVGNGSMADYSTSLRLYSLGMIMTMPMTTTTTSTSQFHQQIWPGDMLLCVDGKNPFSSFIDLTSFTRYMRSVQNTTLVILRSRKASAAAFTQWEYARICHKMMIPPDMPFIAAHAAHRVWQQQILSPRWESTVPSSITMLKNFYTTHPTSVSRQVTPDRLSAIETSGISSSTYEGSRKLFGTDPLPTTAISTKVQSTSKQTSSTALNPKATSLPPVLLPEWRNTWFQTERGESLPYEDNWEFSPEDGQRAHLFLTPIDDFHSWVTQRKQQWRKRYKVVKTIEPKDIVPPPNDLELDERTIAYDFWSIQGFSSFEEWLSTSTSKWKSAYSWNRNKRLRIKRECETVAHISESLGEFNRWLQVRRNQWRLLRRKRRRERLNEDQPTPSTLDGGLTLALSCIPVEDGRESTGRKRSRMFLTTEITDSMSTIDAIITKEEEDRKQKALEKERLVDISFLFDATTGAPDDLVVYCLTFLDPMEYGKLLCLNKAYSKALKAREQVWRLLCPQHWVLPRRPRKPWHEIYFHRLVAEYRNSQKRWDDLLLKCSNELFKGDHLQKIEKLVLEAEKDIGFTVNYISPVVCERNSLLNLAVIYQRHKVVRWLVDQKQADMESYDRGQFTALLNAAWAGDRPLVRFLLQRGANRAKIGFNHYTKGLAHPDFEGLTAEGWARKRGHDDIAELIRLGL